MPTAASNITNKRNLFGTQSDGVAPTGGYLTWNIPLQLASMTTSAADLVTGFVPGFRGKIVSAQFFTTTVGTGTSASQVLNFEIGSTDTTGGVLTLLLADTTTLGTRKAATAFTAANEFTATDSISLEVAASGTVFTAGAGVLTVILQNYDA
jgi:hypothetical protein